MRQRITTGLSVVVAAIVLVSLLVPQAGELPHRLRIAAGGLAYIVALINFYGAMHDRDRRV